MKTGTPIYRGIWALWTTKIVGTMQATQKTPMLNQSGLYNPNQPSPYTTSQVSLWDTPLSSFSGIRNPECMWIPDYIFRTAPEVLAGGLHHKENVFQTFWAVVKCKNTFFDRHWWPPTRFLTPSPINMVHFLKKFHTFFFLLFSSSTTMCFHRWPFIERGLFGKASGVIWSVNRVGVSLNLRLVCLGVMLTIMVSCSLEAPVPPLSPHQQIFFFPAIFFPPTLFPLHQWLELELEPLV